ncbi:MAG: primosomal protein N' [Cyanobacteria bacterium]|nr:primosomal protein N' [Cyanobacteriota bacterium]
MSAPAVVPSAPTWVEVWLEAGREGRIFTYANPKEWPLRLGDLVLVRLQGRRHSGLVVGFPTALSGELAELVLQPIEAVLQSAAIDPGWQDLVAEVAEATHTSLFRTLRSVLPPGWLGQRSAARNDSLAAEPQVLTVRLAAAANPAADGLAALTERQRQVLAHLASTKEAVAQKDLLAAVGCSASVLSALERRGLIERQRLSRPAAMAAGSGTARPDVGSQQSPPCLSPAQAEAVAIISAATGLAEFLLWGVTGSGKTEVYLQAAARQLQAGRSVLLLAPEIGLIPQLLDRCRRRFGIQVLEYHSGMGERERVAVWRACLEAAGRKPLLVVGTRSAVFLPLGALGLIVLDEEHDGSYKQESPMPCYHARDVARLRAHRSGARLVLGSATPSLETWWDSHKPQAQCRLLRLPERIQGRQLPPVHVVDMRAELAEGNRRLISFPLSESLGRLAGRGEQAVVLVPRRGYHTFLSCRSCGEAVLCPHCDVALTVHRRRDGHEWLRCHWCNHRQERTDSCGHCGSTAFKPFGAGTQRVMEQLASELPDLRLLRFDHDTTRGRDGHRRLLERFAAGEADVLVGTQMLAKGMDLPQVTLAVVLAADGLLHRPDLRASEQCLQLLLQLAGRAGRGERPGQVLVQTYNPDHPVIRHLVDGRYERFLAEELALRQTGGQIPFARACLLRLAGVSAATTATTATALVEMIRPRLEQEGWLAIGPAPAPVARVAGRSRWQVLLHGPPGSPLPLPPEQDLRALLPPKVSLAIDPDPLQL